MQGYISRTTEAVQFGLDELKNKRKHRGLIVGKTGKGVNIIKVYGTKFSEN